MADKPKKGKAGRVFRLTPKGEKAFETANKILDDLKDPDGQKPEAKTTCEIKELCREIENGEAPETESVYDKWVRLEYAQKEEKEHEEIRANLAKTCTKLNEQVGRLEREHDEWKQKLQDWLNRRPQTLWQLEDPAYLDNWLKEGQKVLDGKMEKRKP